MREGEPRLDHMLEEAFNNDALNNQIIARHQAETMEAWNDYLDYCHGIGVQPPEPDCAFTQKVRKQILERDGGECQWFTDDHEGGLEAAHKDHSKSNPNYNDPSNGQMLCTKHHEADHIERAGSNGLTFEQNNWAIKQLEKRRGR